MYRTSKISRVVTMRLSLEAYNRILKALGTASNNNSSVGDYCKQVIERHVFRHDKRKYRDPKIKAAREFVPDRYKNISQKGIDK